MSQLAALAPLASALADPGRLRLHARLVLAGTAGLDPEALRAEDPATAKQLGRLLQAGLAELSEDGTRAVACPGAFAEALRPAPAAASASEQTPEAEAVAQLFKDGRLTAMPVRPARRLALLEYLTRRVFEPGVSYGEPEVNIALRQYWDDPSALRRYLIDARLLTRSADGRSYRVAAAGTAAA
ncbi:DUF2087 domain-containing protein [Streptacidiphilus carbonis]|uniref:DUF2087 domain-containing protein n=1 Tax=Streptacidiphilus carbonis TaxID=105422 RepID=UPI0005A6E302|nr:DUF2087 domain-containing protein [Streptacidiphilus carbonis]